MRALITGARGQDGQLLTAGLGLHGVEVIGVDQPRTRATGAPRDDVHELDIRDSAALGALIVDVAPDRVFHLAACHKSSEQRDEPAMDREIVETNFTATAALLALLAEQRPSCRILIAGSSQMYQAKPGEQLVVDESTPMQPASLYGLTKAWARQLVAHYREHRGLFGCAAILFNHESPLRGYSFVSRKVSRAAAMAKLGHPAALHLQDLQGTSDWSSARDVVDGMRQALEVPIAEDFVFASGQARRVVDLLEVAFGSVGLDWRDHATFNDTSTHLRGTLSGNTKRAHEVFGWKPTIQFEDMIAEMVEHDLALLSVA